MGTSISQPSPKSREWKDAKSSVSSGEDAKNVCSSILGGFRSEYGGESVDVIIDAGVQKVAEVLSEKAQTSFASPEEFIASFVSEARRELASNGCNSFFAELALTAGSKAIVSNPKGAASGFVVEYATRVFDYVLSRDLPSTMGSRGIVNLETFSKLVSDIRGECRRREIQQRKGDIISTLQAIFSHREEDGR